MNKESKIYQTRALWLSFFVGLFTFRITVLIRMRDSSSFTNLDLYNIIQISSVIILIFLLLKYNTFFRFLKNQSINYFMIMFLFGILSGLWSENLFYSSYRAVEAYIIFMSSFSILVFNSSNFERLEKLFLKLLFLIGLISLIGVLARRSSISLALLHNNSYPITGSILASYCFGCLLEKTNRTRRSLLKRYMWFGLFIMIIGTSLGSFISFIIAVIFILFFSPKKTGRFIYILLILLIIFLIGMFNTEAIMDVILINKDIDELEGLNGRTRLWTMYLEMIYEKPILGWGFDILARSADFYTTNTHFFLISILGGMGIIGLIIFLIGFIKLIFELLNYISRKLISYLGFLGALVAAFINGGSKGYIGEHIYPETVSFILLISFFSIMYKIKLSNEKK